ncbi:MAG: hypothetical protein ABIH00_03530 [Armatimonadota bacterium]
MSDFSIRAPQNQISSTIFNPAKENDLSSFNKFDFLPGRYLMLSNTNGSCLVYSDHKFMAQLKGKRISNMTDEQFNHFVKQVSAKVGKMPADHPDKKAALSMLKKMKGDIKLFENNYPIATNTQMSFRIPGTKLSVDYDRIKHKIKFFENGKEIASPKNAKDILKKYIMDMKDKLRPGDGKDKTVFNMLKEMLGDYLKSR